MRILFRTSFLSVVRCQKSFVPSLPEMRLCHSLLTWDVRVMFCVCVLTAMRIARAMESIKGKH